MLTAALTPETLPLVRTTYEARTEGELPVLVRYLPASLAKPSRAAFLDIILYSKEQIQKENEAMGKTDPNALEPYLFGVVSVKPQDVDFEQPMDPITMMRNALGKAEGGSGVPLDREKYRRSVEFWSANVKIVQ